MNNNMEANKTAWFIMTTRWMRFKHFFGFHAWMAWEEPFKMKEVEYTKENTIRYQASRPVDYKYGRMCLVCRRSETTGQGEWSDINIKEIRLR